MKAIISNRIYFKPPSEEYLQNLVQTLTYKIEGKRITGKKTVVNVETIRNCKLLAGGVVSIPQGRNDLIPPDYEIEDRRVTNSVPFPLARFPLRDSQQDIYDQVEDTCFINALVGWGKTFTALHLARKFEQKTLIITHTTMLRDQWVEEIEKLFGMRPGIIGSGQFDIEDHFIVVGNVQTVTKHILKLSKEFGTVILDEAHHVPAETFSSIIDGMYSRYRIALSGTLNRTDGKQVVFRDYFGSKIYKPPQSGTLNPIVKILQTGMYLPPTSNWVQKINNLLYDSDYQDFVSAIAKSQIDAGHKVLIVADRTEFLESIKGNLGEDCALITGSTSFEERKAIIERVEKDEVLCIAGSRQIFSEGISVNKLSCVILPVPTANLVNLEQIIGRVMRTHKDKKDPLVVDLAFSSPSEKRQLATRTAFYLEKGWDISYV